MDEDGDFLIYLTPTNELSILACVGVRVFAKKKGNTRAREGLTLCCQNNRMIVKQYGKDVISMEMALEVGTLCEYSKRLFHRH